MSDTVTQERKGRGKVMATLVKPELTIFDHLRVSLIDLNDKDFEAQFGNYKLLLVETIEQIVIAGFTAEDRELFADRICEAKGWESLEGYTIVFGPQLLSKAFAHLGQAEAGS